MKIQIRNGTATIEGYVNAVERFSKVLYDTRGKFIERIMPNVFARALERNKDVLTLLNHDYDRVIARTGDGTAELCEDNIGLRAKIQVTDKELLDKAKKGQLKGWSFGFRAIKQERNANSEGLEERTIRELELIEVSVLDNKKSPAYIGTSIELRDDETFVIEYREGLEEETEIISEASCSCLNNTRNATHFGGAINDDKPPDKEERSDLHKYVNRLNEIKLYSLKATAD